MCTRQDTAQHKVEGCCIQCMGESCLFWMSGGIMYAELAIRLHQMWEEYFKAESKAIQKES